MRHAIAGLPLGSTTCMGSSAIENIIGKQPDVEALLREPGAHLQMYGKEPRPGRKLGHVTRVQLPDGVVWPGFKYAALYCECGEHFDDFIPCFW